jgi:phosphatidylinositol-3-phosphatase
VRSNIPRNARTARAVLLILVALGAAALITACAGGASASIGHVFIIVMENKEASSVIGASDAPYINQLAGQYASAGNYYAISHPSLPNYLALTAGSTFGVTSDCTDCYQSTDNIAVQVEKSGRKWKAYMESLPNPCYTGGSTGQYHVNHDPFMYYDNIRKDQGRCQNVVPLSQLDADLKSNSLPDFAWITPNACSDMHNCDVATGDNWLKTWVPKILASDAWKKDGVLFIVWDEGTSNEGCCQVAEGGKVAALVVSPLVKPGYVSTVQYDHYSLLRTIEEAWGLPLLGEAGNKATTSMTDLFKGK